MIVGVVLASGASTRMGVPKALLELDGVSFIERSVRALAGGCERVAVVLGGPHQEQIRIGVNAIRGIDVTVLENPDPSPGPISSVRVFLDSDLGQDADWAIVHPVDIPGIEPTDVQSLVRSVRKSRRASAVQLRVLGRGAHPVAVSTRLRSAIDSATSLRDVIRDPATETERVEHSSALLLFDIDTPEDLERFRQRYRGL